MLSDKKLVISGSKIELYEFEKEISYGKGTSSRRRNKVYQEPIEKTEEEKRKIRERGSWKSKRDLQRLINANVGVWTNKKGRVYMLFFLTLTFAENIKDVKKANNEYRKFIQKINYEILGSKKGKYLEYVCVPEFQKRGAVHYHIVIFNLPFMKNVYDKLRKLWGKGRLKLDSIDNVKNVGYYVTKYMTKDIQNEKMKGLKKYFSSKGVKRSKIVRRKTDVDFFVGFIPENTVVSKKDHDLEFGGKFKHTVFDVSKDKETKKKLLALSELMRLK
jgi:hypothetical protein